MTELSLCPPRRTYHYREGEFSAPHLDRSYVEHEAGGGRIRECKQLRAAFFTKPMLLISETTPIFQRVSLPRIVEMNRNDVDRMI